MDAIVNHIKSILESKDISASEFADIIGVKRANVSHVLSGRNKPSLEFVIKLCEAFNDVDLNTLLLPKDDDNEISIDNSSDRNAPFEKDIYSSQKISYAKEENKEIERIVLFFKDGSFKEFNNDDNS